MNQPSSSSTHGSSGDTGRNNGEGLPISSGLRILMGLGFLAVGFVQGVSIFTAEEMGGTAAIIDGIGFFLLAGTGVTMLMNRFYSLFLLLFWAIIGVVGSFLGEGTVAMPALLARIMVALVAVAAIGQRGSKASKSSGAY